MRPLAKCLAVTLSPALPLCRCRLIVNHLHEADRKHASPRTIALDLTLHPVFVIGSLVEYNQYFALLELELVIIICVAVVQRTTSPQSSRETSVR
uniref:Putative secreted peptide n=1 Tax=Anopheles braziliensis TaxID=58242 RepID=A0A2M3ZS76_9DIPT